MSNLTVRRILQGLALTLVFTGASAGVLAQTPTSTPPVSPAQQDATRPPGTEQNQPIPEQARPVTTDPTAPPGTQRPAPQAPPGQTVAPQGATPPAPGATPVPTGRTPTTGETQQGEQTTPLAGQELGEPFPALAQPKPLPPMPLSPARRHDRQHAHALAQ